MEGERKESDLSAELRALAENLKSAVQTAWHSDERKNLQSEIEEGLANVGKALRDASDDLAKGPTGQRIKAEVDEFSSRVRSGEFEAKLRVELVRALRLANSELEKALSSIEHGGSSDAGPEPK
ncbi:MAG TPA: hypothetical protein VJ123_05025 [Anaerolineales bacterium]|nr:hypothetical protein [Anaerolineales bacterium]